eukprot:5177315-Amphidinium_carterae.1
MAPLPSPHTNTALRARIVNTCSTETRNSGNPMKCAAEQAKSLSTANPQHNPNNPFQKLPKRYICKVHLQCAMFLCVPPPAFRREGSIHDVVSRCQWLKRALLH